MSKGLTIGELYKVGKRKPKKRSYPMYKSVPIDAHYCDVTLGTVACNTTGDVQHSNPIVQNTSVVGRTGKVARMKSIQIRVLITAGTTGALATTVHMLVLDRKPSGALPAMLDILNQILVTSMLNDVGSTRFKVLKRWNNILVGNSTTPTVGAEQQLIDDYLLLPYDAVYDVAGTTGAIAQMRENAVYLVRWSSVAAGTAAPNSYAQTRVRFYDMP